MTASMVMENVHTVMALIMKVNGHLIRYVHFPSCSPPPSPSFPFLFSFLISFFSNMVKENSVGQTELSTKVHLYIISPKVKGNTFSQTRHCTKEMFLMEWYANFIIAYKITFFSSTSSSRSPTPSPPSCPLASPHT